MKGVKLILVLSRIIFSGSVCYIEDLCVQKNGYYVADKSQSFLPFKTNIKTACVQRLPTKDITCNSKIARMFEINQYLSGVNEFNILCHTPLTESRKMSFYIQNVSQMPSLNEFIEIENQPYSSFAVEIAEVQLDTDASKYEHFAVEVLGLVDLTLFPSDSGVVKVNNVEPASWFFAISPISIRSNSPVDNISDEGNIVRQGYPSYGYMEFVLTEEGIQKQRRFHNPAELYNSDMSTSMLSMLYIYDRDDREETADTILEFRLDDDSMNNIDNDYNTTNICEEEDAKSSDIHHRSNNNNRKLKQQKQRINICIWGSNVMDGQKRIWLQQIANLDKELFYFIWLLTLPFGSSMRQILEEEHIEEQEVLNRPNHETISAKVKTETLFTALRQVFTQRGEGNGEIIDSPFNTIALKPDVLSEMPPDGRPSLSDLLQRDPETKKDTGSKDTGTALTLALYRYAHESLLIANYSLDHVYPLWCRDLYSAIRNTLLVTPLSTTIATTTTSSLNRSDDCKNDSNSCSSNNIDLGNGSSNNSSDSISRSFSTSSGYDSNAPSYIWKAPNSNSANNTNNNNNNNNNNIHDNERRKSHQDDSYSQQPSVLCDIIVYGNNRGFTSDVLITDLGKILNIPTVSELLNLFIHKDLLPTVAVAPSTYALEHHSIRDVLLSQSEALHHRNTSSSYIDSIVNSNTNSSNSYYTTTMNAITTTLVIAPSVDTALFQPYYERSSSNNNRKDSNNHLNTDENHLYNKRIYKHPGCRATLIHNNNNYHDKDNNDHSNDNDSILSSYHKRPSYPCYVIGFMGRLSPEKNPGLFLQAAYFILKDHPFARFTVIGDGVLRAAMENLANRLQIAYAVDFTGWIRNNNKVLLEEDTTTTDTAATLSLHEVLAGIDIVINPSLRGWSETFCIANIEVMSMAIPLVTFAVGGIGDYVRDPSTLTAKNDSTHSNINKYNDDNNNVDNDETVDNSNTRTNSSTVNVTADYTVTSNAIIVNRASPIAIANAVDYLLQDLLQQEITTRYDSKNNNNNFNNNYSNNNNNNGDSNNNNNNGDSNYNNCYSNYSNNNNNNDDNRANNNVDNISCRNSQDSNIDRYLLHTSSTVTTIGRAGRKTILSYFNIHRQMRQYTELYTSLHRKYNNNSNK